MSLITKTLAGRTPIGVTGARFGFTNAQPNTSGDETYLRYYKQISWLRAAVAVIAQGVAQAKWRLYEKHEDGEREEITKHDMVNLLHRPNGFFSGYDFLFLHQVYDELIGRNFWVKRSDLGDKSLWLFPPQYMAPIADKLEYISGYQYDNGEDKHLFKANEVIMFLDPDPLNPMMGAGRAQAVGLDIENQSFMSQWNRNFFYNGAEPGTTISYPIEASITPDEIDRLIEQWNAGHRSYGRAHRAAILTQGAQVTTQNMGQRDMDFGNLEKYNRESILGVFGTSYSMIGGTENVIRANAEAQLFNFARWVLTPRLIRIREKMNMFWCPDYGENLEWDFDDPAPENEEADLNKATRSYQMGVATLNEAREMLKLDPDVTELGDQYYKAPTPSINFGPNGQVPPEKPEEVKSIRKDAEADIEKYWKAFVKQAESYEPPVVSALQELFNRQKAEAVKNARKATSREDKLIDTGKFADDYTATVTPLLENIITQTAKSGESLNPLANPHKELIPFLLSQFAIAWLKTRIKWAAREIGDTSEQKLREILSTGYEQGLSPKKIADLIGEAFDSFSAVRALTIARTEVLAACNIGIEEGYRAAGVQRVKWYTAQDERTCPLCATLHGTIHGINEGYTPPAHPNCRCINSAVQPWEE